jgi:hypothetical protein
MLNNKEKNINYLLENYSVKSKDEIIKELNLSWSYIQKLACLNGIKKGRNESSNDWKFKKLIDYNDNISMYWLGFMIADGHIYNKSNIQINLSIKDKLHLLRIQEHIGNISINFTDSQIRATISDRRTVNVLANDFEWASNKTKNPIKIPNFLSKDALFSLIIGFIDGDGTINKKGHIFVKCDGSWKNNLEYFYYILTGEKKIFNSTSDGLSIIYILKFNNLIQIKERAKLLNLPIISRKWDRIKSRIFKSDKYEIVKTLLNEGNSIKETIDKTKFGQTLVYRVYKEINKN